jgi:hypothetical protein
MLFNWIRRSSMLEAYSPEKTADIGPLVPATDSSIRTPPHPTNVGTVPLPVDAGETVRDCELVAVLPVLSVTVSVMVYVPLVKVCVTGFPDFVVPPRFQL